MTLHSPGGLVTQPCRYRITAVGHPHYGETGTWDGTIWNGLWVLDMDNGEGHVAADRSELELLPS